MTLKLSFLIKIKIEKWRMRNFKYDVILKSYHEKSFLIHNKERINEV